MHLKADELDRIFNHHDNVTLKYPEAMRSQIDEFATERTGTSET